MNSCHITGKVSPIRDCTCESCVDARAAYRPPPPPSSGVLPVAETEKVWKPCPLIAGMDPEK
jgi:hypothetical protein